MFIVAGSNVFGQWLIDHKILGDFRKIEDKKEFKNSTLVCICWSYNIFLNDNNIFITGAFGGSENELVNIPTPETWNKNDSVISGSDFNIVIVCNTSKRILVFNLDTKDFKTTKFVDQSIENELHDNNFKIMKIVMNNDNCLYLTNTGYVYSGLLPIILDTNNCVGKVIDIVLGYEHMLLLTDAGRVYSWGNGRRLQLGHGDLINLEVPTEIKALAGIKIIKISAGGWHSCALSEFGDLYVWGWNESGQLGVKTDLETEIKSFELPTVVDLYDENSLQVQDNVIDVVCGSKHTAILLEDGSVWTTGSNKYGQLGFCIDNIQKQECFKKSYTSVPSCGLMCGPWSTVILI